MNNKILFSRLIHEEIQSAINENINLITDKHQQKRLKKILKDATIYNVEYGNEVGVENVEYYYDDKKNAIKDYKQININDFDDPLSITNYKLINSYKIDEDLFDDLIETEFNGFGEIEDNDDIEMIVDNIELELENDFIKYIDYDDTTEIEHHTFDNANKDTGDLIDDVISKLKLKGKYTSLIYKDENNEEHTIKIRVADHSWNPQNNWWKGGDFNISVVISNIDKTKTKFQEFTSSNSEQFHYTSDNTLKEITTDVLWTIDDYVHANNLTLIKKLK